MKEQRSFTKSRLIGFVCCSLLPLAALLFGVALLCKGFIFNFSFAACFAVLPLAAIGLLVWCIFSGCPYSGKIVLCGLILIIYILAFLFSTLFLFPFLGSFDQVKHYEGSKAEQQYASLENKNPLMPEISEIGQPAAVEYYHMNFFCVFSWERDYLLCRYAPEDYEAQKAALETQYVFQSEPITKYNHVCAPSATLDSYHFRLLSVEDYKDALDFPEDLVLIGYSDASREIVYLTFYDADLDYIDDLEHFILDDCGWSYIR